MNLSLKKLLQQQNVLFISNIDNSHKKVLNILNVFFNEIFESKNKDEALNIYINFKPQLIITEVKINDYNGIDFIKTIRKENSKIPIIILTENTATNILIEAVKLNLIDYLLKPLDINKFIHALNQTAKVILNNGEVLASINSEIKYHYIEKTIITKNERLTLTKNEVKLLELLLANKNSIIKNEEIKRNIWSEKEVSNSAFKSLLNRLSNKIGKETITNSFGIGYGLIESKN